MYTGAVDFQTMMIAGPRFWARTIYFLALVGSMVSEAVPVPVPVLVSV